MKILIPRPPLRLSVNSVDFLHPPASSGRRIALQLVACRCFVCNDTFAIFVVFVLRVGFAVALLAVAAFPAAVAPAAVSSPCGEGGEEFCDLGGLPLALCRQRCDQCIVASCRCSRGDDFGGWRGGWRRGGRCDCRRVKYVLEHRVLPFEAVQEVYCLLDVFLLLTMAVSAIALS